MATKKTAETSAKPVECRLKTLYTDTVVPQLVKEFGYKNINEVPRLEKIVLNAGLGDVKDNSKSFQLAVEELKSISGQNPLVTNSKLSVANFKVRKGMAVGAKVTLRGERMYAFFDKLVSIALPRVRDFRGVNTNLDGRGKYTPGAPRSSLFSPKSFTTSGKNKRFRRNFRYDGKNRRGRQSATQIFGYAFQSVGRRCEMAKNQ